MEFNCKYNHDNVDCFLIDVSSMFNARKRAHLECVARALYTNAPSRCESFTRLKNTICGLKKTIYGLKRLYLRV